MDIKTKCVTVTVGPLMDDDGHPIYDWQAKASFLNKEHCLFYTVEHITNASEPHNFTDTEN